MKSENYQLFGGLNTRWSQYALNPMEFLDLRNYDFQTPAALTQRWGSTQYLGQTFVGGAQSIFEFQRLAGPSYVMIGATGALWAGATTGQAQGLSFTSTNVGYTLGANAIQYLDINWNSLSIGPAINQQAAPYLGNFNQLINATGISAFITGETLSTGKFSYSVLDDYMFAADGTQFFKFSGTTTSYVGLPPVTVKLNVFNGATFTNGAGSTGIGMLASTGAYGYWASYVNERGFEGPIWPIICVNAPIYNGASIGGSLVLVQLACFPPPQYNIQSLNLYSFYNAGTTLSIGSTVFWDSLNYTFLTNIPISSMGSTIDNSNLASAYTARLFYVGSTIGGQSMLTSNAGAAPNSLVNNYIPLGFTLTVGNGIIPNVITSFQINPYIPQYIETYQNTLFLAGFSATPSQVWFSDVAEPEGYPVTNNFEVRTNDGDSITGMRAYGTRLYIFKSKSFHILTGDNPNNFFLQEISDQYGCANHRCAVIFKNLLVFLDRKGIILFDGAGLSILSDKVQTYFDRMNFNQAMQTACMVHDKIRNQILVAIPIDGSSTNNIIIVYDYVMNAWTTYTGLSVNAMAQVLGYNKNKYTTFADTAGNVNWFGPSFLQDNGVGYTLYQKTRFVHDIGDSVQKQFRRLYMNTGPLSATLTSTINFYQDYGSSIVKSTTMGIGPFQARIDYGISAKSLAFDHAVVSSLQPVQINGFTIEHRMQRKV